MTCGSWLKARAFAIDNDGRYEREHDAGPIPQRAAVRKKPSEIRSCPAPVVPHVPRGRSKRPHRRQQVEVEDVLVQPAVQRQQGKHAAHEDRRIQNQQRPRNPALPRDHFGHAGDLVSKTHPKDLSQDEDAADQTHIDMGGVDPGKAHSCVDSQPGGEVEEGRPPRDADEQREGQPKGSDREPAGQRQDSRPARGRYALFRKCRYSAVSAYPRTIPLTKNVPCWI